MKAGDKVKIIWGHKLARFKGDQEYPTTADQLEWYDSRPDLAGMTATVVETFNDRCRENPRVYGEPTPDGELKIAVVFDHNGERKSWYSVDEYEKL